MSQGTERHTTTEILRRSGARPIDADAGSRTPTAVYRDLRRMGFAADEAGNLSAYVSGLRPIEGGWTPREIERLLFMRHLVAHPRGGADAAR